MDITVMVELFVVDATTDGSRSTPPKGGGAQYQGVSLRLLYATIPIYTVPSSHMRGVEGNASWCKYGAYLGTS